jgi:triacylglycerol lipase
MFQHARVRCGSSSRKFAGLPTAFIAVGTLDLFRDENLTYAARLMSANVATELHVYPGAYHVFDLVAEASVTKALYRDCLQALSRAISS